MGQLALPGILSGLTFAPKKTFLLLLWRESWMYLVGSIFSYLSWWAGCDTSVVAAILASIPHPSENVAGRTCHVPCQGQHEGLCWWGQVVWDRSSGQLTSGRGWSVAAAVLVGWCWWLGASARWLWLCLGLCDVNCSKCQAASQRANAYCGKAEARNPCRFLAPFPGVLFNWLTFRMPFRPWPFFYWQSCTHLSIPRSNVSSLSRFFFFAFLLTTYKCPHRSHSFLIF